MDDNEVLWLYRERERLLELVETLRDYITLLSKELSVTNTWAVVHGWAADDKDVAMGIQLREKMARLSEAGNRPTRF